MRQTPPAIFDHNRLRLRRNRSATRFSDSDFLHERTISDIVDRLETVTRDFDLALFIGAGDIADMLTPACGVNNIITMDTSTKRMPSHGANLVAQEEFLPIAASSVDLIVSTLTLHNANDLIGALAQMRLALKPDGLLIAALFAESTLSNLKSAVYAAEAAHRGAIASRFSPMSTIQDLGSALTRAGFALTSVDIDRANVTYREPTRLIDDLRAIGDTNILTGKIIPLTKTIRNDALQRFTDNGGHEHFDIAFLTDWAPHPEQPKPRKPGSATASLRDAIGNIPTEEK